MNRDDRVGGDLSEPAHGEHDLSPWAHRAPRSDHRPIVHEAPERITVHPQRKPCPRVGARLHEGGALRKDGGRRPDGGPELQVSKRRRPGQAVGVAGLALANPDAEPAPTPGTRSWSTWRRLPSGGPYRPCTRCA